MTASIWFPADGEAATQSVTATLARRGFRVVRSFDLRSAVAGQCECGCPHHGTAQCTCQYAVLLAYGATGAPIVVIAHGQDIESEMQVVEDPNAPTDQTASRAVYEALAEAALILRASHVDVEAGG